MTAVNWLIEQLTYKSKEKFFNSWQEDADLTEFVEQAKQMEKDNTIAFGYRCIGEVDSELGDLIYKKVPEEVYNDTYVNKGIGDTSYNK